MTKNSCVTMTAGLLLACGAGGPADGEAGFRAALPEDGHLRIAGPREDMPAPAPGVRTGALLGELAPLYAATRGTSEQLNGMVGSVVDLLGHIARGSPTEVGPDSARWGPMTSPLSPATYQLVVHRVGPGQFAYQLEGRPRQGAEPFIALIDGGSEPEHDTGGFHVNVAAAHQLDPLGWPGDVEAIEAHYAWTSERGTVHLVIVAGGSAAAGYHYEQLPEGAGTFRFGVRPGFPPGQPNPGGLIRSRWTASGAGRADVQPGDAPPGTFVTECWDGGFGRVYFSFPGGSEGNPAACAYAEPLAMEP